MAEALLALPEGGSKSARKFRQRLRLFTEQGGLCHWCKKPMILIDRRGMTKCNDISDDEATIEHLYDKFDPERGKHPGEKNRVLAHRRCNEERSRVRQQTLQIEEKWARSRRHPRRK